nr:MAG TPA: hypothetical protein [Caudoviricetes sp.]
MIFNDNNAKSFDLAFFCRSVIVKILCFQKFCL